MAKKTPDISIAAVRARAKAKGLRPTDQQVRATYNRDVARRKGKAKLSTQPMQRGRAPGQVKKRPIAGLGSPAGPSANPGMKPKPGYKPTPGAQGATTRPSAAAGSTMSRKPSGGVRARPQGGDGTPAPRLIPKGGGLPLRGPGNTPKTPSPSGGGFADLKAGFVKKPPISKTKARR